MTFGRSIKQLEILRLAVGLFIIAVLILPVYFGPTSIHAHLSNNRFALLAALGLVLLPFVNSNPAYREYLRRQTRDRSLAETVGFITIALAFIVLFQGLSLITDDGLRSLVANVCSGATLLATFFLIMMQFNRFHSYQLQNGKS